VKLGLFTVTASLSARDATRLGDIRTVNAPLPSESISD